MKFRQGIALAVAAAAGLALTACTGAPAAQSNAADGDVSGTITFQTWSLKNDTFTPYFTQVIKDFEKKYPDATVKWVDQPADGYEDKVLQQAESGELPDVINLPPDMAYSLAKVDMLLDLTQADPDVLDDYVKGAVSAYSYDDTEGTFGLPWYLGTELNYWNADLLKKGGADPDSLPTTIDEMFDVAETLAKSPEKIATIASVPSPKGVMAAIADEGGSASIFEDGKFVFNTPEAVKIVERYAELYKLGAVSPEALQGAGTSNSNINNFNKGTVAWTTAGPNYIEQDLSVNAPTVVPTVRANETFGNPPLFVQGVSVSNTSKNAATALAFASFLTNNDNQVDFVKLAVGFFPGTKAANEDPSSFAEASEIDQQNHATDVAAGEMDSAEVPNPPQYTENMDGYAKQQIALAITGDISAQEALDNAVEYCQQNLAD